MAITWFMLSLTDTEHIIVLSAKLRLSTGHDLLQCSSEDWRFPRELGISVRALPKIERPIDFKLSYSWGGWTSLRKCRFTPFTVKEVKAHVREFWRQWLSCSIWDCSLSFGRWAEQHISKVKDIIAEHERTKRKPSETVGELLEAIEVPFMVARLSETWVELEFTPSQLCHVNSHDCKLHMSFNFLRKWYYYRTMHPAAWLIQNGMVCSCLSHEMMPWDHPAPAGGDGSSSSSTSVPPTSDRPAKSKFIQPQPKLGPMGEVIRTPLSELKVEPVDFDDLWLILKWS